MDLTNCKENGAQKHADTYTRHTSSENTIVLAPTLQ
jgi:hypothetical protein